MFPYAGFAFVCKSATDQRLKCRLQSAFLSLTQVTCLTMTILYASCPNDKGKITVSSQDTQGFPDHMLDSFIMSGSERVVKLEVGMPVMLGRLIVEAESQVGTFAIYEMRTASGPCQNTGIYQRISRNNMTLNLHPHKHPGNGLSYICNENIQIYK